nr:phosphotransferase [Auraticoccus cholistanensis]
MLEHIRRARWFGGKGRETELLGVEPLPWLTPAGSWPAVRPEIAEIGYEDDTVEQYQLLLSYRPAGGQGAGGDVLATEEVPGLGRVDVHDATRDPEAMAAVLRALVAGRTVEEGAASLRCRTVPGHRLTDDLAPRLFGGEQSNSSVMLGEVAMIKAFRRLEPGRNLDIEVHHALAGDPRARAARLYGWIEAEWQSGSRHHAADLAMVVEQLHQARDGWELALAACTEGTDFTAEAHALGVALRGVHEALADHFPTGEVPGQTLGQTMVRRLHAAVREAGELADVREELEALFARVEPLRPTTQRVHGDFHLGQTLLTSEGWKIIDFEGEPMKTMDERREPDSRWRDVAGLLRSFDYAAGSAAAAASADPVGSAAATAAQGWAQACTDAFLTGYSGDRPLSAEDSLLLQAYVADKAVYEVVYEVRNRPAWVGIPLRALERLVVPDGDDQSPGSHPAPDDREDR